MSRDDAPKGRAKKILPAAIFLNALILALFAFWLRPVADDYCFGQVVGQHGILGGVAFWWQTWSSFVFAQFAAALLVGWPLAHLPWPLASAVPFLVTMAALGWLAQKLFMEENAKAGKKIATALAAVVLWRAWLSFGASLGIRGRDFANLGASLTHWQTLNAAYILHFIVVCGLLMYIWKKRPAPGPLPFLAAGLAGLVAGASGSALSLGWFLTVFALLVWIKIFRPALFARYAGCAGLFCLVTALAVLFTHTLSPGHSLRSAQMDKLGDPFTAAGFAAVAAKTIVRGFKGCFIVFAANGGTLLLFPVAMSAAFFAGRRNAPFFRRCPELPAAAALLLVFTVFNVFSVGLSEALTYRGHWHFSTACLSAFLAICLGGLWCGTKRAEKTADPAKSARRFLAIAIVGLAAASFVNLKVSADIVAREKLWTAGGAPIGGAQDIDDPSGWPLSCWRPLNELRPEPIRRGLPEAEQKTED